MMVRPGKASCFKKGKASNLEALPKPKLQPTIFNSITVPNFTLVKRWTIDPKGIHR